MQRLRDRAARWLVLLAIRAYRRWLSRFTPHCPQTPICSTYALRAVRRHGAAEGLRLTVARLATCTREGVSTGAEVAEHGPGEGRPPAEEAEGSTAPAPEGVEALS